MTDLQKLEILYTSVPENEEQRIRKELLIKQYYLKLGIIKPDNDALVVNSEVETDFNNILMERL